MAVTNGRRNTVLYTASRVFWMGAGAQLIGRCAAAACLVFEDHYAGEKPQLLLCCHRLGYMMKRKERREWGMVQHPGRLAVVVALADTGCRDDKFCWDMWR